MRNRLSKFLNSLRDFKDNLNNKEKNTIYCECIVPELSGRACNSLDVDRHLLIAIPSTRRHTKWVPLKMGDAGHVQEHET